VVTGRTHAQIQRRGAGHGRVCLGRTPGILLNRAREVAGDCRSREVGTNHPPILSHGEHTGTQDGCAARPPSRRSDWRAATMSGRHAHLRGCPTARAEVHAERDPSRIGSAPHRDPRTALLTPSVGRSPGHHPFSGVAPTRLVGDDGANLGRSESRPGGDSGVSGHVSGSWRPVAVVLSTAAGRYREVERPSRAGTRPRPARFAVTQPRSSDRFDSGQAATPSRSISAGCAINPDCRHVDDGKRYRGSSSAGCAGPAPDARHAPCAGLPRVVLGYVAVTSDPEDLHAHRLVLVHRGVRTPSSCATRRLPRSRPPSKGCGSATTSIRGTTSRATAPLPGA
jgi:hypothetical protein